MLKKYLLSVVLVFVLWSALDFVIHSVILGSEYQANASLWRPMAEMKMGLIYLSTFITVVGFTGIYALLVNPKSIKNGALYGLLFGLISGTGMSLGSYSVMPITVQMAVVWFFGAVIEMTVAGLCIGAILKK
ncbi:MAG: hypothetical protein NTW55_06495 [Planctomycetota bacterium]|nr:hypothetical protein [Planctomycetota bacterium]